LVAGFERSLARQLSATMRKAIRQYEQDGSDVSVQSVILAENNRLAKVLQDQYQFIMVQYGARILDGLKSHKPTNRKDVNDIFMSKVEQFIGTWTADKVTQISSTTREQIIRLIHAGELEGLGTREIAKSITERIPSISNVRANTIARTETHSAAGFANESAAEATGLNLKKEWVAFKDGREREAHADADGQVVNRDESFTVDGEQLQYAGDPSGSAGNIINCRCVVLYFEE
jgi:uncharacterized protein with gpF-like domain